MITLSFGFFFLFKNFVKIRLDCFLKVIVFMKKEEDNIKLIHIVDNLNGLSFSDHIDFERKFRKIVSELSVTPPAKWELISVYKKLIKEKKITQNKNLEKYLKKSSVRTSSGVSVITVLTKPYPCPGTCVFCPDEKNMPKSYLSNEPAAQRALGLKFDPVKMVQKRIEALETNGHTVDKIELLVLGGSFTAYTKKYQDNFITKCFFAANTFGATKKRNIKSLKEEQKINEKTRYKIIGITLETRPDEITEQVIKNFRNLGCTRVQIGVQHTDDKILKISKRGHDNEQAIIATRLLKENGFKVDHHFMPDLPGSTPAKDLKMMQEVFAGSSLQPDQIKIYPCIVNEYAPLYEWFQKGKYKPYTEKQLLNLLLEIKKIVPYWVRINRLIRDIPEESITAGNKITNLRQFLQKRLAEENEKCHCIRCREIGLKEKKDTKVKPQLFIDKYEASGGIEYFLSFEDKKRETLLAFLRLRINGPENKVAFGVLEDASIVRELHVYGQMITTGEKSKTATQHQGFGKKLMTEAEKITIKNRLNQIAVISGVGVHGYYRKLGYRLQNTYMVKKITKQKSV
jgi:elongator complex protein 3